MVEKTDKVESSENGAPPAGVAQPDKVDPSADAERSEKVERVVRIFPSHEAAEKAEAEYWRSMTPQQRLNAVGECVREYLRMNGEPEPRFRRVYRVLEHKGR